MGEGEGSQGTKPSGLTLSGPALRVLGGGKGKASIVRDWQDVQGI